VTTRIARIKKYRVPATAYFFSALSSARQSFLEKEKSPSHVEGLRAPTLHWFGHRAAAEAGTPEEPLVIDRLFETIPNQPTCSSRSGIRKIASRTLPMNASSLGCNVVPLGNAAQAGCFASAHSSELFPVARGHNTAPCRPPPPRRRRRPIKYRDAFTMLRRLIVISSRTILAGCRWFGRRKSAASAFLPGAGRNLQTIESLMGLTDVAPPPAMRHVAFSSDEFRARRFEKPNIPRQKCKNQNAFVWQNQVGESRTPSGLGAKSS